MNDPLKEVTALMIQLAFIGSLVVCGYELEHYPFLACAYLIALVAALIIATYREARKVRP